MLKETLKHYRLSLSEYQQIEKRLGHSPSRIELALFSALWSEHCSYKSSLHHLKNLSFKTHKVLSGFGENAGVIDLGQKEKIAFKVESHNHPSRIVPYHGAGTGVGGILRDVFVMNARPIALANYLCFGRANYKITPWLVDGVVKGIGDYGNCMGIPTITGQTEFHTSYQENTIVNALALGYFGPEDDVMHSYAKGAGNVLVYGGASTGRDGIHGASMASQSFTDKTFTDKAFTDKTESIKTCVQVGDPFYGKLLMEACLEVMQKKWVVAAQDMGAAGLLSSSIEMTIKGKLGCTLHLDQVPLRDPTMTPEDILLSETQERVLLVVQKNHVDKVKTHFAKWGLTAHAIGSLTKAKTINLSWKNNILAQVKTHALKAPRYKRYYHKWHATHKTQKIAQTIILPKKTGKDILLSLLQDERACNRQFIYQQYDSKVGAKTIKDCAFPIGVLRLAHSGRALGLCMGGSPAMMRIDSFIGGKDAIYGPALQLASRGFLPLAFTDGLNFGSPENPKVMSSFVACVKGMALATRALQTPVISGNVSFYNETKRAIGSHTHQAITGTPVTACVGIKNSLQVPPNSVLPDKTDNTPASTSDNNDNTSDKSNTLTQSTQQQKNNGVYLVSMHQVFCTGQWAEFCGKKPCFYGQLDSALCSAFITHIRQLVQKTPPLALALVGKFGLVYTIARMLLNSTKGMAIKTPYDMFQERLYEFVVLLTEQDKKVWEQHIQPITGMKIELLGEIINKPYLQFNDLRVAIADLKKAYQSGWGHSFKNTIVEGSVYD